MVSTRNELREFIRDFALLHGTFYLRGGEISEWYIDKYCLLSLRRGRTLVKEVLNDLVKGDAIITAAVGGELGGALFAALAFADTHLKLGIVRHRQKSYGSRRQIEGNITSEDMICLVEDVVTTGSSVVQAMEAIKKSLGIPVHRIIALIDRSAGLAEEHFKGLGVPYSFVFSGSEILPG